MIDFFPSRTIVLAWDGGAIHWYGVMYALAFWTAYVVLPFLGKRKGLKLFRDAYTMLIVYGALGVLIGGRLGYVLFYEPGYFLLHPLDIFAIWLGGMSSHGGFIGVAIAVWVYSERSRSVWGRFSLPPNWGEGGDGGRLRATTRTALTPSLSQRWERGNSLLAIADIITVPAAIGLALGRVGNFINLELYQGYGALIDAGLMLGIAGVCYVMLSDYRFYLPPNWGEGGDGGRLRATTRTALTPSLSQRWERGATNGAVIATFLILYSVTRFFLEYTRIQEWPYTFGFTRGQLLTIPVFAIGVLLFLYVRNTRISREI